MLQSALSNPMIDINSPQEGINIELFGSIEITNLIFSLQAFKVTHVLLEVVFSKELETKSFVFLDHKQTLSVLQCLVHEVIAIGFGEHGNKVLHTGLDGFDLVHI